MTTRLLLLAALLTAGCNQAAERERRAAEAARAEAEEARAELARLKAGGQPQAVAVAAAAAPAAPAAGDRPALPGEETLAPDKAPVGTPLRPRPADPVFRIGNPRFVQEGFGPFQNLVLDYDRQRDGTAQTLTLLFRTPDGQSAEATLFSQLKENSGTIAIRGGFGPWNQIPKNAELYLINTDGRYERKYTFKVSNSVNLGQVDGKTLARDWTPAESAALAKPPPPPKKYAVPSFDPNLGEETKLVGEQTAPGPFRYADPDKHLLGFDYWMAGWDNGKKQHEASPGGFTPIFDRDQPVAPAGKRVMAKDGYAVGGVVLNSRVFVNAFKLIYMKVKDDGTLDPADTYESGWEGTRTEDGKDVTLSGDGRKVIGIVVRRGGVLNSMGLIYAKK